MKYLILLRGINVGGNNIIKMTELKSCLEEAGFTGVQTYIQSGNVVLEDRRRNTEVGRLIQEIEGLLTKEFNYDSKVVAVNARQMAQIITEAPKWWGQSKEYKHNLAFIKEPMTAAEALAKIEKAPDVEKIEAGNGVLYVSSSIKHFGRTKFVKVVGTALYKQMTIRNYNTSQKLATLMQI